MSNSMTQMMAQHIRCRSVRGCRVAWTVLVVLLTTGCGGGDSSTAPAGVILNGTYRGSASDNSGPGTLTWIVTQTASTISGSLTMRDSQSGVSGAGTVSGSLTGTALNFTMSIPAGGFSAPYSACSATFHGSANSVTSATINGTYSGTNSCGGTITGGSFVLTKQ
jgi:hypothetical protein